MEAFGCEVIWDGYNREVVIFSRDYDAGDTRFDLREEGGRNLCKKIRVTLEHVGLLQLLVLWSQHYWQEQGKVLISLRII